MELPQDWKGAAGSFSTWAVAILTPVYPFAGFFQPLGNPPVFNSVDAGAAIPVKFSLGGDRGLAILAAGYPASAPIACDSAAPADAIEQNRDRGREQPHLRRGSMKLSRECAGGSFTVCAESIPPVDE